MKRFLLLLSVIFFTSVSASAQNVAEPNYDSLRLASIEHKLALLIAADPTYEDRIDLTIGRIPLAELLKSVAKASAVNISVKGAENTMITSSFSRISIHDLIYFLCKEYNLDIDVTGNIVAIRPATQPPARKKQPKVHFSVSGRSLSYDLGGDQLSDVTRRITDVSGVNFLLPPSLYTKQVSGYVEAMPFDEAVNVLASANGLEAAKKGSAWEFSVPAPEQPGNNSRGAKRPSNAYDLKVDSLGLITAQISRGNVREIIETVCEQMGLNYFFISPIDQQTAIFVRDVTFNTFLSVMLAGTPASYYVENDIYIFGSAGGGGSPEGVGGRGGGASSAGLFSARVITLDNRSVNKLEESIPEQLRQGLQIKAMTDLNGIVVAGDEKQVARVENFLRTVDKSVKQVTIDVMIVDAKKSFIQEVGIGLGVGKAPVPATHGTLSPGIDMNFNASSVNNMINRLNGVGSVNLGRVGSNFYANLQALEENGDIQVRSTPKLSTMNGHEASLKSGQTQYYKEIINTYMGTQNPLQTEAYTWKNVEANLALKITPYISNDNSITLEIEIEQTEFLKLDPKGEAPPSTATRNFQSQIRVQDGDMVLLGGIDRNVNERISNGLPFIARIPVLRWIFGKSYKKREDHKLNVFITPRLLN